MKDTFYFSHDYNTRTDEKIRRLIMIHGMAGYGIFWAIVEDLYNNANALRTDYKRIAYEMRTTEKRIASIINDFDLFIIEGDYFGSKSIENRLSDRNEKSEKARQSAFKRWNKNEPNANALRTQCDSNAIKERKGKDIKESKENKSIVFYNPEILFDEFKKSDVWFNDMLRIHSIESFRLDDLLRKFIDDRKVNDELSRPFSEQKRHFNNWIKKQVNGFKQDDRSAIERRILESLPG